jgi:prefoldin subunit 5
MILPKKDDKKEELKAKYGVIKEIPNQPVEEASRVQLATKPNYPEGSNLDLLLRLEKLEGKFSAFEEIKDDFNERISRLSEEIGELRSSFLELDKNFTSLEARIEKTIEVVNEIQPDKFSKDLQKKEAEILKMQADIESLNNVLVSIKKNNETVRSLLEKIKNIDNVVSMYKKLGEKIQLIDDTKFYVDRLAGKSETIFAEMESKMKDVEYMKAKLQKIDDLTVDLVKMLDGISIKIPKLIEKDIAEKYIEESVRKSIAEINKNYTLEFQKIVDQTGKKYLDEAKRQIEEEKSKLMKTINEISSLISSLKDMKLEGMNNIKVLINFIQAVNSMSMLSTKEEIEAFIQYIKSLRSRMIQMGIWSKENQDYLIRNFNYLSYLWEYNGNQEIKRLFDEEIALITRGT